jgi:hypothetical protein
LRVGVVFITNTTIGDAFSEFKIGRSHLALVRRPPTANQPGAFIPPPCPAPDLGNSPFAFSFGSLCFGHRFSDCVTQIVSALLVGGIVGIVTINDVMELIVQSKILGEEHRHDAAAAHRQSLSPAATVVNFSTERTPLLA